MLTILILLPNLAMQHLTLVSNEVIPFRDLWGLIALIIFLVGTVCEICFREFK